MGKEDIIKPSPVLEEEWDFDENASKGTYCHLQDEKYDYIYKCNVCGEKIFLDNYCSKCGQKLR